MHLPVALENSTLRRISNFFSSCFQVSRCCEYPRTFGCNQTFRGWGTCRNMREHVHRCRFRFRHTSFLSSFVPASFSPSFWGSISSWNSWRSKQIWNGWCLTNEEDNSIRHVWTYLWSKMSASWFLVSMYRIRFRIKINSVKQPIQSGSGHTSHCGTSTFDYHQALEPERVPLDGTLSILVRSRFGVRGSLFRDEPVLEEWYSWTFSK